MAKNYFADAGDKEAEKEIANAFRLLPDDITVELEKLPKASRKCMVIEPSLIGPFDIMLQKPDVEQHKIEKIFKLDGASMPSDYKFILYVIPAEATATRSVINLIKADLSQKIERCYTIAFAPKKTVAVETLLETEGCIGNRIRITDIRLSCFPIDLDLISMNCPQLFKSVFLNKDFEYLEVFADSLLRILTKLGIKWQNIRGRLVVGQNSQKIVNLLNTNVVKPSGDTYSNHLASNHTVSVALMDRDSDYMSAFLHQIVYEGRLDDTFGINLGKMKVDASVIEEKNDVVMTLDFKDRIFNNIRHLDPGNLIDELRKLSTELKEEKETGKRSVHKGSSHEMFRFVTEDLKDLMRDETALKRHYTLYFNMGLEEAKRKMLMDHVLLGTRSDGCQEIVEEQLSLRDGLHSSLRLLSLWSLTQDGLQKNTYDAMTQLVCQAYGLNAVVAIYNLRRAGILYPKKDSCVEDRQMSSYSQVRKHLELFNESQTQTPNTPHKSGESHVFFGHHTPVISRLIERCFACSNKFSKDWFKNIPLKHHEYQPPIRFRGRQVIIIGFVGGCTYSEINSLRMLARYYNIQILILTSCTMNSHGLIEQLENNV